jgi:hypothetical protein
VPGVDVATKPMLATLVRELLDGEIDVLALRQSL